MKIKTIQRYTVDSLADAVAVYIRYGWEPFDDPIISVNDYRNQNGTITRLREYRQRMIKA